jgi:CRP/FNR family cyclic AMP-dependent transcriptional regulator
MGVHGMDEQDRRAAGIRLIEAQPDLADGLDSEQTALARRHVVAALETVEPGPWTPNGSGPGPGSIGLLVIDGVVARDVRIAGRWCSELLGPGDLLRPWDNEDGEAESIATASAWNVLERTRFAVLDERFARVACRWPQLMASLVTRTLRRSRWMAIMLAISNLTRVDERVVALMWHLADRWGRVTPDGVVVPVPLTHEMIGKLVGAHRPSVTSALGELQRQGALGRRDGGWVLHGEPPRRLDTTAPRLIDRATAVIDPSWAALMPLAAVFG